MSRPGRVLRCVLCGAIALAVLVAWPAGARAQDGAVEHDTQLWLLLLGQFSVSESWLVTTEVQPRWNDDVSQRDQLILRPAVGRRLGARAILFGGYAYIPRWVDGDVQPEQRIWQQLSLTLPRVAAWTPSLRFRQEQRFVEQWGDASHRFRALGRVLRPIDGAGRWSVALWDEVFLTLDETASGPQQGFDQNRLYATVLRKVSATVTVESGYMWQVQPSTPTRGTRHGHTLFTWITYTP